MLVSAPLTFILVAGLWVLYNLNNIQINENISISEAVGVSEAVTTQINFEYIIIAVAIYIVLLYFLYGFIFKQSKASKVAKKKVEK